MLYYSLKNIQAKSINGKQHKFGIYMKISEIIGKETIIIGLKARDKKDLLVNLVKFASKSGKITDEDEAIRQIFEREKIMSTGVGNGIALPHAKTNAVTDSIGVFAVLSEALDYEALDDKPVEIVFMLLGKENNVGMHLRLLSKISRILNDSSVLQELKSAEKTDDILELIRDSEEKY